MKIVRSRRLAGVCAAVAALTLGAIGAVGLEASSSAASTVSSPIVRTGSGVVRGVAMNGGDAFLGLPYAAPPTGNLRWRPPRAPADWSGIRSASSFAPSCPQPVATAGPQSEDCLYLNVYTSNATSRPSSHQTARPVLVWIHGGGFVTGAGRQYDPSKLAADGTVVVTINYRLGALGFLAHPALASSPGGPAGNYGLMDEQAALNWVHDNIRAFGGDTHNVTIAGESAGGLAVLAHLISPGSRGLFQRAIVESGSFGLHRQSLSEGEAFGKTFASQAGCTTQTAACLRSLPTTTLLATGSGWPGQAPESAIVDGKVITESFDMALEHGRLAKVPVLNGTNHNEEAIFVLGLSAAVSGGKFVPIPYLPVSQENYQQNIAGVLGVSDARATAIAAEYPVLAYPEAAVALSALINDSEFACPALQMDTWTAKRVPTFAYEFNDDAAPGRAVPAIGIATHTSELGYLFDLPDAQFQDPLTADQQRLADSMQRAWARFAAKGNPASTPVPWPAFQHSQDMLSLVPPQPQPEATFASNHHCGFWGVG
jgi:para-nitrobenzyl esterase